MTKPEFIKAFEEIESLPTLPVIVQQIQKLIVNPKSNMSQIAQVIENDQAISARVIRLVNSAFYGMRERISSIQRAIVILGLNTVKNIVIGVSIVKTFNDSIETTFFEREKFWLHTLSTAMGSKLIAQHLHKPEPEDYFLAGLLHDIGLLIIDQFFHKEFAQIIQDSQKNKAEYLVSEQKVLGLSHGEVGEILARKWNMPEFIIDSIRYHHLPTSITKDAEANRDKVAIVHLADAKSLKTESGNFLESLNPQYSQPAFYYLRINEKLLDEIYLTVEKDVKELAKEWGIWFVVKNR